MMVQDHKPNLKPARYFVCLFDALGTRERLFAGIEQDSYVYFVHSYYLRSKNIEDVAATTHFSVDIHAAVERDNVFACQFHPEKSSTVGLQILKNFIEL